MATATPEERSGQSTVQSGQQVTGQQVTGQQVTSAALAGQPSWQTHPQAYALVCQSVAEIVAKVPMLQNLSARMLAETGTELLNWVDRLSTSVEAEQLTEAGFRAAPGYGNGCNRHPQAQLPTLIVGYGKQMLTLKVESVVDFLEAHRLDSRHPILGSIGASLRKSCIYCDSDSEVWVAERHGYTGWDATSVSVEQLQQIEYHSERFRLRRRDFENDAEGSRIARKLIEDAVVELGRDRTADLFFAAERSYWQSRNEAARLQRMRQARLGLGWANHDHHTYRSSRAGFSDLVKTLELLGMECRERFYAGREAGWGAQVMEHPTCGVVVFADVDLGPEEIVQDFAHQALPPRDKLGTVGLWCALHGEAFLQAGLHHLECEFDFEAARDQLQARGVPSMNPFTDMHHLRQSFTVGERWMVDPKRAERARSAGWITAEQAERFVREGTIGSHLEILQRREATRASIKRESVTIITETDPRNKSLHNGIKHSGH